MHKTTKIYPTESTNKNLYIGPATEMLAHFVHIHNAANKTLSIKQHHHKAQFYDTLGSYDYLKSLELYIEKNMGHINHSQALVN